MLEEESRSQRRSIDVATTELGEKTKSQLEECRD